jgi:hypothetical protein
MKTRKMVALSVASFIIIGTTYLGYKTWDTIQTKDVINAKTKQLPSISFSKIDGSLIHLDSLRGTKELLVINYFNPGCDHCKSMVTEMFHEQSRLETVHWLMITSENIETTKPFADSMKLAQLPMVTVISDTALLFAKTFGTASVPSFFVYKAGKLIRKHSGECSIQYLLK